MEEKEVFETFEDEAVLENRNYSEEILELIRSGKTDEEIAEGLADYHDNDIAAAIEFLSEEERKRLYNLLGNEAVSDIFTYLDDVEVYIEELDADTAADVIEEMDADDAVDVLEELDEEKRKELLELIEPEAKEDIELIDSYGEDEFGSIMTTNFITVSKDLTVKQAMRQLITQAAENDNISTIYVLDNDNTFYGAIELKSLIIARHDTSLESLIITSYPFVYDTESISETIDTLREYSEDSIPVLSIETKTVIGVVTSQDMVEIVDEEMSEDYAKFAGLTEEEDLDEPLAMSMKKRIPWLVVLLILGLGISSVIGIFENVVKELSIIVCFQSLILGMAGNTGTQSLAVTIRVLMNSSLTAKERFSLVFKEIRVGFLNGAVLGLISFIVTSFYIHFLKFEAWTFAFSVASCVALSLIFAMIIASFTGTVIPLTLKRLKIDPAVASGPLITTINDFVSVIIYYGLAWMLLINI